MTNLLQILDQLKDDCFKKGRFGYSDLFRDAKKSLSRFCKSDHIEITSVDKDFLRRYQIWMLSEGKWNGKPASMTTVAIYLRQVKVAFNYAIEDLKVISKDIYPFSGRGFKITSGRNFKRALDKKDLSAVLSFKPKTIAGRRWLDVWKLSYYANGANFCDLLLLTRDRIKDDKFTFIRKKTSKTSNDVEEIVVWLLPEAREIIDRLDEGGQYVLPFLNSCSSDPLEIEKEISATINKCNKYMRSVAKEIGVDLTLSTYFGRHSYATTMMRNGVPLKFISKSFGHKTITTTERYISGFENEESQKYMQSLVL